MSSKFSPESAIELVMLANAKPVPAFFASPSCGLLVNRGHFYETKPNF